MAKLLTLWKKRKNLSRADIRVDILPEDMRAEVIPTSENPLFCVTIDGEYLRTPNGSLIVHEDERAIRELAAEIDFLDKLDVTNISLYNLCSTKIDFVDQGKEEFTRDTLVFPLLGDPVLMPCAGPEYIEQMKYLRIVVDYLEENHIKYPNLPQIPIFDGMEEFIDENIINRMLPLAELVNDSILHLNNWEHTVFITVAHAFNSPVLGLMLAKKRISPQEFAVTYYTSLAVNSKIWGDTNRREEQKMMDACTRYAECMVRFLDQFSPKLTEAEEIIRAGESKSVEFKSTLRWSIKAKQNDEKIEYEVLKTIVAFLNTDGGTLLVGVEDNGNVLGIDLDNFPNEDKYLLYFKDLIVTTIGREYFDIVKFGLEPAKRKEVLLVKCGRSSKPAFVKHDKVEDFYIRTGPSSAKLSPSEMLEYSKTRFHSQ